MSPHALARWLAQSGFAGWEVQADLVAQALNPNQKPVAPNAIRARMHSFFGG